METKEEILSRLGASIRSYRESAGYSQEDLAHMCGYMTTNARSTMSKIESGSSDLPVSKLLLIAKALNVRVTDLIAASPTTPAASPAYSWEERDIIARYRMSPELTKDHVCMMLGLDRADYGAKGDAMSSGSQTE